MKPLITFLLFAVSSIGGTVLAAVGASPAADSNDWKQLWQPSSVSFPAAVKLRVGAPGDLGLDLENREWLMIPTRHHQVLFQESAEKAKVVELCHLIDGVYVSSAGAALQNQQHPSRRSWCRVNAAGPAAVSSPLRCGPGSWANCRSF